MNVALKEGIKAYKKGELPIGAVIVKDGKIIARAHNLCETLNLALNHAEMLAIKKASKKTGDWRLNGCTLYVTLEPCRMCSGAIINSRIDKVVFGAFDTSAVSFSNGNNRFYYQGLNHKTEVFGGLLEEECRNLLKDFFIKRRNSTDE